MNSVVTPLTVVLAGIEALPVTIMPARMPVVLDIGTSLPALPTAPFVNPVNELRLTTTFWLIVAS